MAPIACWHFRRNQINGEKWLCSPNKTDFGRGQGGSLGTFIYMSHFSNSEEFKHPLRFTFHSLPIPLIKINRWTRLYWGKQIKIAISSPSASETWHAQFEHLIKHHPVKSVVIRQLILSFGSAYSLEMLFSKSTNVTGNFFTWLSLVVYCFITEEGLPFSSACRRGLAFF